MTTPPNRRAGFPARNPTAAEVLAARKATDRREIMKPEQITMRDEIMARYDHVDLKWPGHLERTTGAEVLLRCAANEVVFARRWHTGVTQWRNELPLESQGSLVGDYAALQRLEERQP